MSFFDEDDEPPRSTQRTRVRPSPPPRRGRPLSGGTADAQTLLVRRMVAGIAAAVILLLLFFLVRACNNTRRDNALRDYNRQVSALGTASSQTGDQLFSQLDQADQQSQNELYQGILGLRGEAENTLKQARDLNVPGEMAPAQQSLLILLELRRDGLTTVASQIRDALGDEGEAADQAIENIAGAMSGFNASDVLYQQRVQPFIQDGFRQAGIGNQEIAASQFTDNVAWLAAPFVASSLGQELSTSEEGGDGGGNRDSEQPTGPGLHGTGLDATSYGSVTLQPGTSNRLTYVEGQPFTVAFTNQGENDEFNVRVTVRIRPQSGDPITLNKTVEQIAVGERATVELPLNRKPPIGAALTIETSVAKVPGEKTTDNNKSSYPTLFAEG